MDGQFQTISSSKKNIYIIVATFAVSALLALFGLMITVAACIFFEAVILFTAFIAIFAVSKTKWLLEFQNATLTITNLANHQQYYFNDLTRADFVFTQTAKQKAKNCGHLKIVGSSAVIYDVAHFAEMQAYIEAHFQ